MYLYYQLSLESVFSSQKEEFLFFFFSEMEFCQ